MSKSKEQAYVNILAQLPFDASIIKRLDRAKNEVLSYGYSITVLFEKKGIKRYKITKASTSLLEDNGHSYSVTNTTCSCPDFDSARSGLCKHRLAVMLLEEMERD